MALIVEDGTGITLANSYDTVAAAQAYFDLKGITITITEESLINATQYLDLKFGRQYSGAKIAGDQSLEYPRTSFTDSSGFTKAASTIHNELKNAMYEAAKLHITGTTLFDDTDKGDDKLQSITNTVQGAVSQSKTWFAPTNTNTKSNIGKYLVNILTVNSGYTVRVV